MTVAPELPPGSASRRGELDSTAVVPARAGRRRTSLRHPAGTVSRRPAAGPVQPGPRWTAGAVPVAPSSATAWWSGPVEGGPGHLPRPAERAGLRRPAESVRRDLLMWRGVLRPPGESVRPDLLVRRGVLPRPGELVRSDRVVRPAGAVRLVGEPAAGTGREHRPAGPVRSGLAPARVVRPARPGLRLTRRAHLLLGLLAALAAAVAVIAATGRVQALDDTAPVPASAPAEVVVAPGDTLWSIAERVAPDRDPRGVVEQVRRLNGLPSGDVQAGQRLRLRGS